MRSKREVLRDPRYEKMMSAYEDRLFHQRQGVDGPDFYLRNITCNCPTVRPSRRQREPKSLAKGSGLCLCTMELMNGDTERHLVFGEVSLKEQGSFGRPMLKHEKRVVNKLRRR